MIDISLDLAAPTVDQQHDDDDGAIDDLPSASGICMTERMLCSKPMRMTPATVPR